MTMQARRRIESFYPPEQLQTASPGRRLGGYVLDALVALVTLGIGWLIWLAIVMHRGQTPGKQLLGMYVMREDGSRAGGWPTFLREFVIKGWLFGVGSGVIGGATGGVGLLLYLPVVLWCIWDHERQCLWDKLVHTYVAYSPGGFRPSTAAELRLRDEQPPARSGRTTVSRRSPSLEADPPLERYTGADALGGSSTAREGSAASRLRELQRLLDEGLITDEQHEERRARIIEEL